MRVSQPAPRCPPLPPTSAPHPTPGDPGRAAVEAAGPHPGRTGQRGPAESGKQVGRGSPRWRERRIASVRAGAARRGSKPAGVPPGEGGPPSPADDDTHLVDADGLEGLHPPHGEAGRLAGASEGGVHFVRGESRLGGMLGLPPGVARPSGSAPVGVRPCPSPPPAPHDRSVRRRGPRDARPRDSGLQSIQRSPPARAVRLHRQARCAAPAAPSTSPVFPAGAFPSGPRLPWPPARPTRESSAARRGNQGHATLRLCREGAGGGPTWRRLPAARPFVPADGRPGWPQRGGRAGGGLARAGRPRPPRRVPPAADPRIVTQRLATTVMPADAPAFRPARPPRPALPRTPPGLSPPSHRPPPPSSLMPPSPLPPLPPVPPSPPALPPSPPRLPALRSSAGRAAAAARRTRC